MELTPTHSASRFMLNSENLNIFGARAYRRADHPHQPLTYAPSHVRQKEKKTRKRKKCLKGEKTVEKFLIYTQKKISYITTQRGTPTGEKQ